MCCYENQILNMKRISMQKYMLREDEDEMYDKGQVINYGKGATKQEGETFEVLPLQRNEGAEQVLALVFTDERGGRGGSTKEIEVGLTQVLEVLAILKGVTSSFHPLNLGAKKFYPVLRGGRKTFLTWMYLFCNQCAFFTLTVTLVTLCS